MYDAIARRFRPRGWTYMFSRRRNVSLTGLCDFSKRKLFVPYPDTPEALQVLLHEVAHVILDHGREEMALEEYEAEMWSFATMRLAGVPVTREMRRAAKDYVSRASGFDQAPAHVRKWCKA